MVHSLSRPHASAALLDEPDVVRAYAGAALTQIALEAGGAWRWVRFGQHGDAGRLATVGAYAASGAHRDAADRRSRERSRKAAQNGGLPTERLGTP